MQAIIPVILKSILLSGLLFLYYTLFLRQKKLYIYNRFYLLASVILSIGLPFQSFEWYTVHTDSAQTVSLLQVINRPDIVETEVQAKESSVWTVGNMCAVLYLLTSLFLLMTLIVRIVWISRLRKNAKSLILDGVEIVETNVSAAPFSFLHRIYWKKEIDMHSDAGQLILKHELCHIEHKHTLDKLFMQLVLIIAWINPVFWLIRKELSLQHEFIADEKALENNSTEAFARMILQSRYSSVFPNIVHPFFHSSIKRRLMMLNKTNKTRFSFLRRVIVLPLAAMAVFFLSFKVSTESTGMSVNMDMPVNRATQQVVVLFDAGHGGKDRGAVGPNGALEKDLNLKICQKLKMLAAEYNIDARMTRDDDSYPGLEDRTDMSNAMRPDLFVSIHVNKSEEGEMPAGYEVIVSEKNSELQKSKLLASAVSARLAAIGIKSPLMQRGLHVLKESNCPAILIECGNIQNDVHLSMLTDNKKLESFCRHILSAIVDYQHNK